MNRQSVDKGGGGQGARWGVYNSTVNLAAALNDPGKGKLFISPFVRLFVIKAINQCNLY